MASMYAKDSGSNKTGWDVRHNAAVDNALATAPTVQASSQESTVVRMLSAWAGYAKAHREKFESTIGEDYVLGPAWEEIGLGIRALLNGETGRLDCGTLDAFILDTLGGNGVSTDNL